MRTVTTIFFAFGTLVLGTVSPIGAPAFAQDETKSPKKLDLSTPKPGETGKYGGGERARPQSAKNFGTMDFGKLDLGSSQLRFDGSRKSGKDAVHEATGFDQTPGSTTFRSLTPAQKSGTPPYVGFTLTKPMTN